jgi:hypothetical protein
LTQVFAIHDLLHEVERHVVIMVRRLEPDSGVGSTQIEQFASGAMAAIASSIASGFRRDVTHPNSI